MILEAARRAFSASGDVRGTTIKHIADEAGISEGIIYRHFESKDELFVQAAVDPLTKAVKASLDKIAEFDLTRVGPELRELSVRYWTEAIDAIAELVPLLGLVLFGLTSVLAATSTTAAAASRTNALIRHQSVRSPDLVPKTQALIFGCSAMPPTTGGFTPAPSAIPNPRRLMPLVPAGSH